ncbi:AGAP005032-PB-like protein [Anopheles sinensis]|uniref:AGAP005032-PB-like protein n=1 Tax=Anopheles sinensis TaxID=74873 RepID=A0A084WDP7_ANOSI|nr:AGAP005032-PB-like protein [Anopheles sinensis]
MMKLHRPRWSVALPFRAVLLCAVLVLNWSTVYGDEEVPADVENTLSEDAELYVTPEVDPSRVYFAEHFDDLFDDVEKRWTKSKAIKDDAAEEVAKYDGEWSVEQPQRPILSNDFGLVLKSKAKHAAISSRLNRPFVFNEKPLVVQYEVNLQEGQECGGSYIKLLSAGDGTKDLKNFHDKTPYTIMFGPDKCGNDVKLHFIFRHVNPVNGTITEKHCNKQKDRLDDPFKDKRPHLYQLIVRPDNTYTINVDHKTINEGSLLTSFTPPVNPPAEIDDPEDRKPQNWDDREKIPVPDATKPDDWNEDEPAQIADPKASKPAGWLDDVEEMVPDSNAVKPDDWDNDMDGEWEPPLIPNPLCEKAVGCGLWKPPMIANPSYKGKWRPPLIANVNYQGKWAPRKIPNPDFFEDLTPFRMTSIAAVGIEIWSMSNDILFDNILISDDVAVADEWAAQTFDLKVRTLDRQAETVVSRVLKYCNNNPWMWAVLVVVVGLPVALLIYFLCFAKADAKAEVGRRKKMEDSQIPTGEQEAEELQQDTDMSPLLRSTGGADGSASAEVDDDQDDEDDEAEEEDDDEEAEVAPELAAREEEASASDAPVDSKVVEGGEGVKKRRARKD